MSHHTASRLVAWLAPGVVTSAASAAQLTATIEIPQLDVAEYHRPYVAAWIEAPDRSVAVNLAVWYDVDMRNDEGKSWLKDLRQWWRKTGRELTLPADGLSGPTRPVGKHEFKSTSAALDSLAEGEYALIVEAAREVGGRELVRVPFKWSKSAVSAEARGERELGAITLRIQPN